METLKFAPLQSCVDLSFWSELAKRKLDTYKLSEEAVSLKGFLRPARHTNISEHLTVNNYSFEPDYLLNDSAAPGCLINVNTLEAFKQADKKALFLKEAEAIWRDICSGDAEADPQKFWRFLLITYGDLKHYHFYYWFAFPGFKTPEPATLEGIQTLQQALGDHSAQQVAAACDRWLHRHADDVAAGTADPGSQPPPPPPAWLVQLGDDGGAAEPLAAPLTQWAELNARGGGGGLLLALIDPCHLPSNPGWLLRNLLVMVAKRWRATSVKVLCVRDTAGRTSPAASMLLDVRLPALPEGWGDDATPEAVGWEANAQGKTAPRFVDVSKMMAPLHQAAQAVDLNLKLMRWRAAPSLDLQRLQDARCLLLGAGTLGCAVSRTLLAWGVRHITFVDSSRVAFSNPVRQWLFDFDDCLDGGRPKAEAAAEKLSKIFPAVSSRGVQMSIPMPGHPPSGEVQTEEMRQAAEQLHELVDQHDLVFLLTDTRESRWLPSLLAAALGKVAITAALGFDNFVVMRHGAPPLQEPPTQQAGAPKCVRLGCYFCNDVVAPLNSLTDRTLDQQCTVARPGLAPMAGATSVELAAALLQHPQGLWAPASTSAADGGDAEPPALGEVPHMVRGHLFGFRQVCMEGRAFSQCTACSPTVANAYLQQRWDFLLRVLQEPRYLEELTGLASLQAEAADACAGFNDDGEGGDDF